MLSFLFLDQQYSRDSSDQDSPNGSSDFFDEEDMMSYHMQDETDVDDADSSNYHDYEDMDDR